MSSSTDLLKIGEFARLADTNLRTLRYYEEIGLLAPAARSAGGFRYYRGTDINRVNLIRGLQELGLHLDRIRELISSREAPGSREALVGRVREALTEHDRLLSERMLGLAQQRAKVAEALAKIEHCRDCPHRPGPDNNYCEPCTRTGQELPEHLSALF